MTQDEYNKLTDDKQIALAATEVMEWEWKEVDGVLGTLSRYAWHTPDGPLLSHDRICDARLLFNPKRNLNDAFMLVDKMEEEGFRWELYKGVTRLPYSLQLFKGFVIFKGRGETKNKAIMLATLRAKGVVE